MSVVKPDVPVEAPPEVATDVAAPSDALPTIEGKSEEEVATLLAKAAKQGA